MKYIVLLLTFFLIIFASVPVTVSATDIEAISIAAIPAAGAHKDEITSLINAGNTIISAGEDGFIVTWNTENDSSQERFQLSPYGIISMAKHPNRDEICVIDQSTISVWDFTNKKKLFSVNFKLLSYINYSANGSYIIAAGLDGTVTLLNSFTGELVYTLDIPQGTTRLAITGRNERTVMIYQSSHDDYSLMGDPRYEGQIIYYNLDSQSVTARFSAPSDLTNTLVFGNNRFIAGLNRNGVIAADTTTGEIVGSIDGIGFNSLLCPADEGFYCLSVTNRNSVLYRFTIERNGNLVMNQNISLSSDTSVSVNTITFNNSSGSVFLGSKDGELLRIDSQGKIIPFNYNFQRRITDIAASGNTIAFLTEDSGIGFIPLDYSLLQENHIQPILENKNGYTNITSVTPDENGTDRFIVWQKNNTRLAPAIVYSDSQTEELLNNMTGRFPLRSVKHSNGKLLVLDSGGNISIYNMNNLNSRAEFTFSAAGAIDAAIIAGENYFVISRSVMRTSQGLSSPFLFVNTVTGETVPVSFPNTEAGTAVFPGSSGKIYAAAVEQNIDEIKTAVINLSASSADLLLEYPGEASYFSIAESDGNTAIACGSEGAKIFTETVIEFERTQGLPVKLLGTDNFFISLDSEGSIAWHDNKTGIILAVYKLESEK